MKTIYSENFKRKLGLYKLSSFRYYDHVNEKEWTPAPNMPSPGYARVALFNMDLYGNDPEVQSLIRDLDEFIEEHDEFMWGKPDFLSNGRELYDRALTLLHNRRELSNI